MFEAIATGQLIADPYKVHREICRGDLSGRPKNTEKVPILQRFLAR